MKVQINNLNKVFYDAGKPLEIIKDLSCEFQSGKSTAIVGRSGIGKSTLLQVLAGLEKPSAGEVFFDQQNASHWSTDRFAEFRRNSVGFIFQFPNLLPEFSARENTALPLALIGAYEQGLIRAGELLDWVGLSGRADHRPTQMSGGEQQRLSIARALVNKPSLILADEPTGSLDPITGNEVGALLLKIAKAASTTLIAVTHNLDFAQRFDAVYEMQPGGNLKIIK